MAARASHSLAQTPASMAGVPHFQRRSQPRCRGRWQNQPDGCRDSCWTALFSRPRPAGHGEHRDVALQTHSLAQVVVDDAVTALGHNTGRGCPEITRRVNIDRSNKLKDGDGNQINLGNGDGNQINLEDGDGNRINLGNGDGTRSTWRMEMGNQIGYLSKLEKHHAIHTPQQPHAAHKPQQPHRQKKKR